MINQQYWVAITVGVFLAGIAIGYSLIQDNSSSMKMQEIVNDPNQWMDDPKHVEQMVSHMSKDHDFVQQMIMEMMEDPNIRIQMLGHMPENPEMMEGMRKMMGDNMSGMQSSDAKHNMMNHP